MTLYFNYDELPFYEGQLQKDIRQEGYAHVRFPVSEKKATPHLQWDGVKYNLTSLYILSRAVHRYATAAQGELILEHMSSTTGVPLRLCAALQPEPTYLDWLLNWRGNDMDRIVNRQYGRLQLNSLLGTTVMGTINKGGMVTIVLDQPLYLHTRLAPFEALLTGDPFPRSAPPSSPMSVTLVQSSTGESSVIEGFDFQNDINGGSLSAGFGTFGNTIDQAGASMNQAGEDYIFDFKASKTADSSAPEKPPTGDIVQCIPLYDNSDQVSTFVVPYGSAMSDEITKMFMTGTFQMFYTLLIAFVILFMTPILYKNYFAVAKRHGSSDDIEYGNKITYSCNVYFVLFTIMMIVGVLVDAAMFTHSITEMGFAMMIIIFFMCTYLFTLMLRGAGLDPNIYGHLQTKTDMMELINLYGRFMSENFNTMYTIVSPAILILLCFGISVGVYRSKSGDDNSMPFGNMILLFFFGLFMILATFGTFINRSMEISAGDAVI